MTYKERYAPRIPFNPYLTVPIRDTYAITEGYIYSKEEHDIHGWYIHGGIDFDCDFGTPVYAAASGLAVATYHRFVDRNKDKTIRLYEGKPLGLGFGYMIQIYHYDADTHGTGNRITQYGHLSHISPALKPKFYTPKKKDLSPEDEKLAGRYPWIRFQYGFTCDEGQKEVYMHTHEEVLSRFQVGDSFITSVTQGQLIGRVGNSGILWGDVTYTEGDINITNEKGIPALDTWDHPHLHFEEATRNEQGVKVARRDPFNLYLSWKWYQNVTTPTLFES